MHSHTQSNSPPFPRFCLQTCLCTWSTRTHVHAHVRNGYRAAQTVRSTAAVYPGVIDCNTQMYARNTMYAHAELRKRTVRIIIESMNLLARLSRPSYEFGTAVAVLADPLPPPMLTKHMIILEQEHKVGVKKVVLLFSPSFPFSSFPSPSLLSLPPLPISWASNQETQDMAINIELSTT